MAGQHSKTYVRFKTGECERLVDVNHVVEILPMVLLSREQEDNDNAKYAGVLDYRGELMPAFVIDGDDQKARQPENFLIVIRKAQGHAAVVADEVEELVTLPAEDISVMKISDKKDIEVGRVASRTIKVLETTEFFDCDHA